MLDAHIEKRIREAVKENPDLAMPEGISLLGRRAWRRIVAKAVQYDLTYTGGCKVFYSPQEWRDRGEEHATNAELIVVYDGADIGALLGLDKAVLDGYAAMSELDKELRQEVGVFSEECTNWYCGIYPDRNITYLDMKAFLNSLPDDQLNQEASVYDINEDTIKPVVSFRLKNPSDRSEGLVMDIFKP